ncbi:MAG: acylphosphatase [Phycisphaerales bacterium]|nr:acylphosphatase [Phycisphaerales bacterium]
MVQRTVLFEGRVQGVGFRYTTCEIAQSYDVTGYVKNLPDGRVEMVAEGAAEELDRFQAEVARVMERNIRKSTVIEGEGAGSHAGFRIRY